MTTQADQETMDGTPSLIEMAGGTRIKFQLGPVKEFGVNGVQIEDIIGILVLRLEGFQRGPFKSRTNALAITKLEEARLWLFERTRKRETQGVEGRNLTHSE